MKKIRRWEVEGLGLQQRKLKDSDEFCIGRAVLR